MSISGKELEQLVEAWLQVQGWRTHRAADSKVPHTRFSRSHDIFGVFDVLGVRRLGPGDEEFDTWAIQTTVAAGRSARRKKIAEAGPWPRSWRVSVVHHDSERVGRGAVHRLFVEDYEGDSWGELAYHEVDVKALEEHRRAASAALPKK